MSPKILALYLPQFYPTKENDEWWGNGFTEWTNVGRAKPLFRGHDQPRVPTELGYYDLRLPSVREQQVQLAREAGIAAFCYWHYWFGNGKRLLNNVFDDVLLTGKPDFPFCLAWANHSWYAKSWDKTAEDKLLIEQTYPGLEDERMHFGFLLKAFKDSRYFKIEGKPLFYIFDPFKLPKEYLDNFRKWTRQAGFPDLYVIANSYDTSISPEEFVRKGYDAVSYARVTSQWNDEYAAMNPIHKIVSRITRVIGQYATGRPRGARNYAKDFHHFITEQERRVDVVPQLIPQWDHSPRSGSKASAIYYNSTPKLFGEHVREALDAIKDKPGPYQLLILKSWNEWGEGNYIEPDLTNGKGYINKLKEVLNQFDKY